MHGYLPLLLSIDPANAETHVRLGLVYQQTNRADEAVECFQQAIRLNPRLLFARLYLAYTWKEKQEYEAAEEQLNILLKHDPGNVYGLLALGGVHECMNRPQQATVCYQKVLELDPSSYDAHVFLGCAEMDLGNKDAAVRHLEAAVEMKPELAAAYAGLARAKYYAGQNHGHIAKMTKLVDDRSVPSDVRKDLHYSLCEVFDQAGRYDLAFTHAVAANRLSRVLTPPPSFDVKWESKLDRERMHLFDQAFIERLSGTIRSEGSENLIFIVGMPRSGTTLAEQILASHPSVRAGGERLDISNLLKGLPSALDRRTRYPRCLRGVDGRAQGSAS